MCIYIISVDLWSFIWWCWCCFRPQPSGFGQLLFEVPVEGGRQRESAERSGSHTFRCSHTESPGSHYGGLEGPWCTVETAPKNFWGQTQLPPQTSQRRSMELLHFMRGDVCRCLDCVFFRASAVCDCCEPAFLKRRACWIPTLAALAQFLSTGTPYFRQKKCLPGFPLPKSWHIFGLPFLQTTSRLD